MASYLVCMDDPPPIDHSCVDWEWREFVITLSNLTQDDVAVILPSAVLVLATAWGVNKLYHFLMGR